jgi:hypothetical protein
MLSTGYLVVRMSGHNWQRVLLHCCYVRWSCWFLLSGDREGSYLAVALVGPFGSRYKLIGKVPTLL